MRTWIINHIPAKEQAHYSDDIKTVCVQAPDIEGAWDVFLSVYRKRLILSCYEEEPGCFTNPRSRL